MGKSGKKILCFLGVLEEPDNSKKPGKYDECKDLKPECTFNVSYPIPPPPPPVQCPPDPVTRDYEPCDKDWLSQEYKEEVVDAASKELVVAVNRVRGRAVPQLRSCQDCAA